MKKDLFVNVRPFSNQIEADIARQHLLEIGGGWGGEDATH